MTKHFSILLIFVIMSILGGCTNNNNEHKDETFQINFITNCDLTVEKRSVEKNSILTVESLPKLQRDDYYFDGWYLDDTFIIPYYEQEIVSDLTLYAKWRSYSEIKEYQALNSITLINQTYKDLTLPTYKNGFTIVWTSSRNDVIDNKGKYYEVESEIKVTLTATIITDNIDYQKSFDVIAKPIPYDELFEEAFNSIIFKDPITNNITLKTSFSNGISGVWQSNKEEVINNQGIVKLTNEIETIQLTLTLKLNNEIRVKTFEVKTAPKTLSVNEPEYFIQSLLNKGKNVTQIIMDSNQIASYNQTVYQSSGTNVVELDKLPLTISKTDLLNKINSYSNISKYNIYNNETGKIISSTDKDNILLNRNLNNIKDVNNIRYAVSTTHTSLRSYPTMDYSSTKDVDRFQETGFSTGIPMVIYHESLDQKWFFVQMYNYFGWVSADCVGTCDRDTFLQYLKPNQFIVILAPVLNIDGELIRMGYKLPYTTKDEINYQVQMPKRSTNGTLNVKSVEVAKTSDISDGFIPYNYTNLLNQAFKMLNIRYSWGDKTVNAFDCSSTQASIYGCFGFINGRNTSNQWKTDIYGKTINSITNESLKNYQVGTLLYTSSHVLMYIGTDDTGNCWLLHNTSTGNICKVQKLTDYGTSGIKYTLEIRNMN